MFFVATPTDPQKRTCAVTGRPAKYHDPQTGLWYSSVEAFKTIRTYYQAPPPPPPQQAPE